MKDTVLRFSEEGGTLEVTLGSDEAFNNFAIGLSFKLEMDPHFFNYISSHGESVQNVAEKMGVPEMFTDDEDDDPVAKRSIN